MRDVLCNRPVRILHSRDELYASTALAGAGVFVGLRGLGCHPRVRIPAAMATAMAFRYAASSMTLKLPSAPWLRHAGLESDMRHHAPAAREGVPACSSSQDESDESKNQAANTRWEGYSFSSLISGYIGAPVPCRPTWPGRAGAA